MPSKVRQHRGDADFPQHDWRSNALRQVRTLYTAFAQGLFAAAPPGTYRWAPTLEDTEIVITGENPVGVESVGLRPAISFSRGPVQSNALGNDDMLEYNFETGAKKKGLLISGMMNVNCLSRNDLETESLAWIVAEQLWMHRELLMRAGFFEIGRQFVIGSPSPAGSLVEGDNTDDWFATVLSLPFQFSRTSQFTPINRQLVEQIGVTFNTQGRRTLQRDPVTGLLVDSTAPGVPLHMQPHPLNPAQQIVVRPATSSRMGLRPPSMGGRVLPIQRGPVEQSSAPVTVVTTTSFKV